MTTLMKCILMRSHICQNGNIFHISMRGRKFWPIPPDLSHIEMPPFEDRTLPALEPIPHLHGLKPIKMPKNTCDVQGPELIHNKLIHRQFGIIALTGGHFGPNHINTLRMRINKYLDLKKMFAIWRIEPPWKAMTKRSQGKRHGGGKGNIHHYSTPVRAGHIIVEVGGHCEYEEVMGFLERAALCTPCDSLAVSQEILDQWRKEHEQNKAKNVNPFSFERVVKHNMSGCKKWISPYDEIWYGVYD